MLGEAKLVGFLGTTQPEVCRAFYENALGLKFVVEEPSTLVFETGGVMLRIGKVGEFTPLPFTVLGWEVDDLEAAITGLGERGVSTVHFEGVEQNDLGIASFGETTKVAWLKDPDGNILSVAQHSG